MSVMEDCLKRWGDGSDNAEWIRRLDVVLADERVTNRPRVKRRLQGVRRHAVKAEEARLNHIELCMKGLPIPTDGSSWPKAGLDIPVTHFRAGRSGRALLCKTSGNHWKTCCPFCRDDSLLAGWTREKLLFDREDKPKARAWSDLTKGGPHDADFSDSETQEAAHGCVAYALLERFITMKEDSYGVVEDGRFIEVKA